MRAAKKITIDSKVLQDLVPLNALSNERFQELSGKIVIEEVLSGRYLFRKGDRDGNSIFVLDGKVNLIDGFRKVISEVEAGTDISRYPIANQQPRPLSARAVKKVVIARIDSSLLDVYLTWDQTQAAEAVEIGADSNKDWMTRLLQSEAFIKIPPSMIQSLLIKMEKIPVVAGETVVQQGESGDYFYTVHQGRCVVTRHEGSGGEQQTLAELNEGDSFGEEALVSDVQRNATVTMLSDGTLMRLAKQDFVELLKDQLVKHVDHDAAVTMVDDGAVWVDVRTEDEYSRGAFEDSVNIPLSRIRDELSELVFNATYILCCDTGRRSESAGFLLSHKGFDVYVLDGGIPGYSCDGNEQDFQHADSIDEGVTADVVQLSSTEAVANRHAGTDQDSASHEHDAELARLKNQYERLTGENSSYRDSAIRLTEQVEQLRGELGESVDKLGALYSQTKLDAEQLQLLRSELSESGEKLAEFYSRDGDTASESQALQLRCKELEDEIEDQTAIHCKRITELDFRLGDLQTRAEASGAENALLLQQAGTDRQTSDAVTEQFNTQLQQQADMEETLNKELDQVRSDLGEARTELKIKLDSVAVLESDHGVLEQQVCLLQQHLDAEQQTIVVLRETLVEAEAQAVSQRQNQDDETEKQLHEAREKIGQLQNIVIETEQLQLESTAELDEEKSAQEKLQQALSDAQSLNNELAAELESVQTRVDSSENDAKGQSQQLQQKLDASAENTDKLEKLLANKDAQLMLLQDQSSSSVAGQEPLQQEIDLLKQQLEDMSVQLQLQEERARILEDENKESEDKAHDDLTRKNDNEKELRGQIDRLRKKTGQLTIDHQQARDAWQSDMDHVRDQISAERQERAEERSEMAARQRELKEQLTGIATEHETNMSNHTGAIEEARDAARHEEQERLKKLLDTQAETENQVVKLQKELKAAHQEVSELAQQEKDRRQIDMELMEEQNQQAVATIDQLETQLKQLTDDRDSALDEQQALRGKLNTLRGEVEVARGLMGVSGQVEEPAKLRSQLNESRKNIEIALRLRAEAERERDRAMQEKNALLKKFGGKLSSGEKLHVPSLDGQPAKTSGKVAGKQAPTGLLPAVDNPAAGNVPGIAEKQGNTRRPALGVALFLGVVAFCAVAAWLTMDTDTSSQSKVVSSSSIQSSPTAKDEPAAEQVVVSDSVTAPVAIDTSNSRQSRDVADVEVRTETVIASEWPELPAAAIPVVINAPFRDGMKGNAKGPWMMKLPAGTYQMGSTGNSLNFDESPLHEVSVVAFSISQHEVTFSEYDRFARATGRRLPYDETWGRGDHPVINVSWHDANAYTRWLSGQTGKTYRLPSESEWEYAARGGSTEKFPWHAESDELHANCFNCGSDWDGARTASVGSFAANEFGLLDVSGNVQEWTADCYHGSYQGAPHDGSAWLASECDMRVVRGGAYSSPLDSLRSAKRSQYNQDARLDNLGFRIVRTQ